MYSKKQLDSFDSRLTFIKNNIISINTLKPITADLDINYILNQYHLVDAIRKYKKDTFGNNFNRITINCNQLSIQDIIIGYYSAVYINNMMFKLNTEIINVYEDQRDKFFQLLRPQINLNLDVFEHRYDLFLIMKEIQTTIYNVFKSYGFILPSIQQLKLDLIEKYKDIRLRKRKYLPEISELLINDTLYIVNDVHGSIEKLHNPDKIDLPDTMNFYRILTSDYGSCALSNIDDRMEYIEDIQKFLKIPYKNTDKNNKKRIKTIISLLIKKIKTHMNFAKSEVNERNNMTVKNMIRYKQSGHHVNDFKSKKIISKDLVMNLNENDDTDTICVVHPTMNINLMDYLDVTEDNGFLYFNLKQIFDLINDVKYVLFIDLSCSGAVGNFNNTILNNFKAKAKEIEGQSITNNIKNYVNTSPYNISPLGSGLNLVTGSNLNRTKKSNN
jgi:hypothetical protein